MSDWRDEASCKNHPRYEPHVWDFKLDDEREDAEQREARHHMARSVCRNCPVKNDCLAAGVQGRESGVWGGHVLEGPATQETVAPVTRSERGARIDLAEVEMLLNCGTAPDALAERLKVKPESLYTAIRRRGTKDLRKRWIECVQSQPLSQIHRSKMGRRQGVPV